MVAPEAHRAPAPTPLQLDSQGTTPLCATKTETKTHREEVGGRFCVKDPASLTGLSEASQLSLSLLCVLSFLPQLKSGFIPPNKRLRVRKARKERHKDLQQGSVM